MRDARAERGSKVGDVGQVKRREGHARSLTSRLRGWEKELRPQSD